jgi:hypothetical protein
LFCFPRVESRPQTLRCAVPPCPSPVSPLTPNAMPVCAASAAPIIRGRIRVPLLPVLRLTPSPVAAACCPQVQRQKRSRAVRPAALPRHALQLRRRRAGALGFRTLALARHLADCCLHIGRCFVWIAFLFSLGVALLVFSGRCTRCVVAMSRHLTWHCSFGAGAATAQTHLQQHAAMRCSDHPDGGANCNHGWDSLRIPVAAASNSSVVVFLSAALCVCVCCFVS